MKKSTTLLLLLFISIIVLTAFFHKNLNAQWMQTNGPNGGWSKAIYSFNGYLFAGSSGAGVFRSSDNGNSWSNVLTFSESKNVESIASQDQYIFVATKGIYRSSDNGNSWIQVNNGFPSSPYRINTIVSSGQYLICGSYRTYRSSN